MAYSTIGYHTCRDEGGLALLKREAPFAADQDPFLSLGFYFWQNEVEDAHYWGRVKSRFPKGYAICRCQLMLSNFLDLSDSNGLYALQELEREMLECGKLSDERLPIGQLIQWLRDLDDEEIFPYDSVRMRQEPPKEQRKERMYAASQPHKLLILNTQFIICVFSKKKSITSCAIVYPEHYRGS